MKTVKEQNQEDRRKRALKQTVREMVMSSSLDDSKCRKGHSYRKETVDIKKGEILLKPKWVCVKCGREL